MTTHDRGKARWVKYKNSVPVPDGIQISGEAVNNENPEPSFFGSATCNGLDWRTLMATIMIAEDDLMLADMAESALVTRGYDVCGIVRTVTDGVALSKANQLDFAVLDVRLANGGLGTDIAATFGPGERPAVLYATGNAAQLVLTSADGEASLSKPYSGDDLVRSLELVAELVATGHTTGPIPRGFQVLPSAATPKAVSR